MLLASHYLQFKGHSERELLLATVELRKRLRNQEKEISITAKRLAEFLAEASAHEAVLTQRLQDTEAQDVLAQMGGYQAGLPKDETLPNGEIPLQYPISRPGSNRGGNREVRWVRNLRGIPVMTEQPPSFPHRLLHQSVQEKLAYFKAYTVAHPALKQVDQAVWNALREPAGASLIFVFGPTGAGKTTLLAQIEKRLKDLSVSQMGQGEILLLHSDLMRYHLRSTSSNGPITIKGL